MSSLQADTNQFTEIEPLPRLFDLLKEYSGKLSELITRASSIPIRLARLRREARRFGYFSEGVTAVPQSVMLRNPGDFLATLCADGYV
jgi:hypothetical protein